MPEPRRILLIGGTGEAVKLNTALYSMEGIHLITSLAGRTKSPSNLLGEILPVGFSDVGGMDAFLKERKVDYVVDASHPFANQISNKSNILCQKLHIPYIRFERSIWTDEGDDQWIEAKDMIEAASLLEPYDHLFLTIGRQELDYFEQLHGKKIVIRSIEDIDFYPDGSDVVHICDRGPFSKTDEISLMKAHDVQVVVSKNSGGDATYAKILAARALSLPVIMINRPDYQPSETTQSLAEILEKIRLSS